MTPRTTASLLSLAAAATAVHAQCLWTPIPATGPLYTYGGAIAYHTALQRTVFVDYDFTAPLRTWSWDGAAWTLQNDEGPSNRFYYAIAYDSARNRLVLFGGWSGLNTNVYYNETWEWDQTSWTRRTIPGPPARSDLAMVFDQARARTVIFGGYGPGFTPLGDTWEYDGASWTLVATTGPSPRADAAMTYDSLRSRTILFGGESGPADVWEWDGAAWIERPSSGPPAQGHPRMTFDALRDRAILVVSQQPNGPATDTWELDTVTGQWTLRARGFPGVFPISFDPVRARAVLPDTSAQTWEYDGTASLFRPFVLDYPHGGFFVVGDPIVLSIQTAGSEPLTYRWRRDGQPLFDNGRITGADTATLSIHPAELGDTGQYDAHVTNACGSVISGRGGVTVVSGPCYANCDGSTITPILNINDFICFLRRFATHESYANCDGSTQPPALNVNDFVCFMTRYAEGCH